MAKKASRRPKKAAAPAQSARRLADKLREQRARELFPFGTQSPEEFAVRHAQEFCRDDPEGEYFAFNRYRYRSAALTRWIDRFGELLRSPSELEALRVRLLTPAELAAVRIEIERVDSDYYFEEVERDWGDDEEGLLAAFKRLKPLPDEDDPLYETVGTIAHLARFLALCNDAGNRHSRAAVPYMFSRASYGEFGETIRFLPGSVIHIAGEDREFLIRACIKAMKSSHAGARYWAIDTLWCTRRWPEWHVRGRALRAAKACLRDRQRIRNSAESLVETIPKEDVSSVARWDENKVPDVLLKNLPGRLSARKQRFVRRRMLPPGVALDGGCAESPGG